MSGVEDLTRFRVPSINNKIVVLLLTILIVDSIALSYTINEDVLAQNTAK